MAGFDEYVRGRGGDLLRLARALTGAEDQARDLVFHALADARRQWARLEQENPHAQLRLAMVRGYLSPWRRSRPARADDPLAELGRRQRAAVVLRFLARLGYLDIADHLGGSANAAAKLTEQALETIGEQEILAALDAYDSTSPGTQLLIDGAVAVSRRRSRRRLSVAASVIAVLVVVSALNNNAVPKPAPQPTASPSAFVPPAVRLIPAIFPFPVFPYLPSYLPADAGPPEVHQNGDEVSVHYHNLSLYVTPTLPLAVLRDQVELIWQRDGRWLRLVSDRISFGEADKVISGLVPGEVKMTLPPFTITLMPAGYVLRQANPRSICLAAKPDQPTEGLCVTALPDVLGQASWPVQPKTVSIQGREAHLIYPSGIWAELWIHLDNRNVVRVGLEQQSPAEMLSSQDLLTFAEGVLIQAPA